MSSTTHTGTNDLARERSIADAIWREILWLMPHDRAVDIKVRGERIDVTLGPPPASPRPDAPTVP